MVAVPIPARSGSALGTVVLHTVAPREFDEGVLTFLAHTASLVAGAIENARLYEDTRRRVEALTRLSSLSRRRSPRSTGARSSTASSPRGVRDAAALRRLPALPARPRRRAASSSPPPTRRAAVAVGRRRGHGGPARHAPPPRRRRRAAAARRWSRRSPPATSTSARSPRRRSRPPFGQEADELLRAVANQLAVALHKAELIERLTAENIVRDLFEALESGGDRRRRGARPRRRLRPRPPPPARSTSSPRRATATRGRGRRSPSAPRRGCAGSRPARCATPGRESLRALLPLRAGSDDADREELERALRSSGRPSAWSSGVSTLRRGVGEGERSLREAADAAHIARALVRGGGALAYADLGAYKYLVRLPLDEAPHDRHCEAVERLVEYDRRAALAARRARSSSTCATAAASRRRRGRSTSTRTRCASASTASRSSPASTSPTRTCSRSSSRSSSCGCGRPAAAPRRRAARGRRGRRDAGPGAPRGPGDAAGVVRGRHRAGGVPRLRRLRRRADGARRPAHARTGSRWRAPPSRDGPVRAGTGRDRAGRRRGDLVATARARGTAVLPRAAPRPRRAARARRGDPRRARCPDAARARGRRGGARARGLAILRGAAAGARARAAACSGSAAG